MEDSPSTSGTRSRAISRAAASARPSCAASASTERWSSVIALTGATGQVGRELVRLLVERGERPRVLARDVCLARRLFGGSVDYAQADLDRPETLPAGLAGADLVFLLTPATSSQLDREEHLVTVAAAADIVVVTTGAPEPVLTRGDLAGAMAQRSSRRMLIVDLGVPRNVEPDVHRIENLFLHPIDSLQKLIEQNNRVSRHPGAW